MKELEDDERMTSAVNVKMMQTDWLRRNDKDFLDLVEIINDCKNKSILRTTFVSSLLSGYWDRYFDRIFKSQFLSFMIYMFAMTNYLVFALKSNLYGTLAYQVFYFPLVGFNLVFICNQFSSEYMQWKNCENNLDYFTDYWNINDLIYLVINSVILFWNINCDGTNLDF